MKAMYDFIRTLISLTKKLDLSLRNERLFVHLTEELENSIWNPQIDAVLMSGAILAIVISCVMVTIEIRNYKLYQMAKNKPVRLVLTREFLEKMRIEHYNAKETG